MSFSCDNAIERLLLDLLTALVETKSALFPFDLFFISKGSLLHFSYQKKFYK